MPATKKKTKNKKKLKHSSRIGKRSCLRNFSASNKVYDKTTAKEDGEENLKGTKGKFLTLVPTGVGRIALHP